MLTLALPFIFIAGIALVWLATRSAKHGVRVVWTVIVLLCGCLASVRMGMSIGSAVSRCQLMGPIVEALAGEVEGKAKVGKLNVDEHPATATKYGIMSIPSLKIYKDGKVVKEFVGVQQKDALKKELLSL